MLDKTKNIVVTITFVILLILFFLANILKKDTQISIAERMPKEDPGISRASFVSGQ